MEEDKILTKICSKCHQEKTLDQYHKNGFDSKGNQKYRGYCKDCANKLERERYKEKKNFIASFKEKCQKCGEIRNYVLDFHHKEKEDKDFTIGCLKKGSLELIKAEIDKCIVLCANCHREFHFLEKEYNISLDDYLANNYKIKK